jgi:basic membrane lipoprotein Med (substrate-binding protein (PBP1-ABC) superfamily)
MKITKILLSCALLGAVASSASAGTAKKDGKASASPKKDCACCQMGQKSGKTSAKSSAKVKGAVKAKAAKTS